LASLGVAAREAGHAIQHAQDDGPLAFRSWVVRPAMLGSNLGTIVMGLGLAVHATGMVWIGVLTDAVGGGPLTVAARSRTMLPR
jgi:Zn-dependent membrane protease YugP